LNKPCTEKKDREKLHPTRLYFLDSLRGLAAIYIFLYHMVKMPQPNLEIPRWAEFVKLGGMGITFFFLVSSFSLYLSREAHKEESHFEFYLRRFFRIAPLFYLWIILSLVRNFYVFDKVHSMQEIFSNLFFFFNLWPGFQVGFVWASWMIGVLCVFYFIFPFVHKLIDNFWKASALFFISIFFVSVFKIIILYIPFGPKELEEFLKYCFVRHFPVFSYGIFLYFFYKKFVNNKPPSKSIGFFLLSLALFLFSSLTSGKMNDIIFPTYYWQPVIFSIFILGFAFYPISIFINKSTQFIGKISYSIYLSHPTLIFLMKPVYERIYDWPINLTIRYILCVGITFVILVPISFMTYKLIEVPGGKLGKKILDKRKAFIDGKQLGFLKIN
jgi:peptidoglycan/LPS O-acetylase OafA/YrhL